jgi:two-component system, OmpR family, sensor histidine kinase ResE
MSSAMKTQSRFVSLRWRLILPTFIIVLVLAMSTTYVVGRSLPSSAEMSRVNILRSTGDMIAERANAAHQRQAAQALELAQTPGLAGALQSFSTDELHALLEVYARRADLDSIVLLDAQGQDVYGLLRDSSGLYAPVTLEQASSQVVFAPATVILDGQNVGTAQAGVALLRWIDDVRNGAAAEVGFYSNDNLLATTVDSIPTSLPTQYLETPGEEPFQALELNGSNYLGSYFPLRNGTDALGVFVPDNAPFAVEAGQQLVSLTLATVVAGIIIALFFMSNYFLDRVNKVRQVTESLAEGDFGARTGMLATDEIGALGHALDRYTESVQERHDSLRASLRRQRREIEHLTAVIESLPDGVIIEDLDGNVTLINERAKRLIGENHNFFKRAELREITSVVTDTLGPAYAPGLYSLGTPQRMELDGKMLRVQAFAVMSLADQRVGTVIVVRDVTRESQRERARNVQLDRMSASVERERPVTAEVAFSREIKRHVGSLQKLIVEMRELVSDTDAQLVNHTARNMPLETLIWAVANEWKQVAQAANVTLNVSVERRGLHIVGDERRLRWALGNIIDNAIKYTPPGGKVSLEIKDEESGFARLRVRDNGVGIAADELPHVFTRFYRGTPVSVSGRALRVPGTGQGLTVARQIIESMGGRVHLRSSPGIGTAVYFTLPLNVAVPELEHISDDSDEETLVGSAQSA